MPAGPPAGLYERQVPVREYEDQRARKGWMQLIENPVTGHSPDTGQIVADFGAWGKKATPTPASFIPKVRS